MKNSKTLKRILGLLMASMMIVTCFGLTACKDDDVPEKDDQIVQQQESDKAQDGAVDNNQNTVNGPKVGKKEVVKIILKKAEGSSKDDIIRLELDFDDGHWEYEGKVLINSQPYEFTIDGDTGTILEWEYDD